jgi:predicted enzyme related to lactoylglutathione lyase
MDKVVHFEIPVDDWERAKKFYSDNFGWNLMGINGPDEKLYYMMAHAAATDANNMVTDVGAINGGLFKRGAGDDALRIVIQVDSIEDAIKKIEASGGKKLSGPDPIPNGRYAKFKDSEGNVVGIIDNNKM